MTVKSKFRKLRLSHLIGLLAVMALIIGIYRLLEFPLAAYSLGRGSWKAKKFFRNNIEVGLPYIIGRLKHETDKARARHILQFLNEDRVKRKTTLPHVIRMAGCRTTAVRLEAVRRLGDWPERADVIYPVLHAIKGEDAEDVSLAAESFLERLTRRSIRLKHLDTLITNDDTEIRALALATLHLQRGVEAPVASRFHKLIDDPSPQIRRLAIKRLSFSAPSDAFIPIVVNATKDSEADVREMAYERLVQYQPKHWDRVLPVLLGALKSDKNLRHRIALDLTEINRNLAYLPLLSGLENVDPSNWKALSKREPDLPAIYQQVLERGTDEQKNLALELVHPSSKVILQTLLKHCGPDPAEWSDLCWKMLRRLGPALKPLTPKICEALQGTESRTLIINLLKTLRAARGGVHPVLSLLESRYRFHGNQRFWLNQQERMLEDEIAFTGMMALQNADKDGVEALKQLARRSDYRPLANSILDSIEPVHTKEPDTGDARIRLLEKQPTADLIARLRSASRSQKEAISKILRGRDDVPASAVPVLIKSVDRNTVSDVCEIFARMGTRAEGALPFLIAETGKLNSAATYALAAVGPSKKEIVVALTNALGRGSRHAFRALSRCGKNARPALDSMIAYLDSQRYLTPAYMTLMERVATPEDIMRSALKYIPTTIFDNALIIVFRRYRERMRKGAPMLKDQLRNAIKEGAEQEARVCLEALALIKAPGVFELIQEALKVPRTFRAGAYAVIAYGPEAREFLPVILPEMEANPGLINAFRSWGRDACPVLEPFLDSGYRITRSAAHQTLMQIEENRPDKIRL